MPFSSGTFSLVSGNPVVTGTTISSTWANNTLSDISSNGLSICLLKDGTQTPTANITMGGFKLTNLAAATAVADAPRTSQVQNGSFNILTGVSGTNTITASVTPTPAAYAEGQVFTGILVNTITAQATLNVSGLGAQPIFLNGSTATSSSLRSRIPISFAYLSTSSSTGFHVLGYSGFQPIGFRQDTITLATEQATTSGTSIDFTGIPSWVKNITVMLDGVSLNGTSSVQIQLGISSGVEATGYAGAAGTIVGGVVGQSALSAGFLVRSSGDAATVRSGALILSLMDSANNTWVCQGSISSTNAAEIAFVSGAKSLAGVLDRVRITTVNGTDAFDAGAVNISYSG